MSSVYAEYRFGGSLKSAFNFLWDDGGFPRYYAGLGAALFQGPLSRFGDTAVRPISTSLSLLTLLSETQLRFVFVFRTGQRRNHRSSRVRGPSGAGQDDWSFCCFGLLQDDFDSYRCVEGEKAFSKFGEARRSFVSLTSLCSSLLLQTFPSYLLLVLYLFFRPLNKPKEE